MAIFSNASWGPAKTAGRYTVAIIGSSVATLAIVALFSKDGGTAADAIKSIAESLGSISVSLAALTGAAGAIYAGARGTLNSTPGAVQASVAERPDRMVLSIDPNEPERAAIQAQTIPGVKAVITSADVAAATPQYAKIVGPDEPAAKS